MRRLLWFLTIAVLGLVGAWSPPRTAAAQDEPSRFRIDREVLLTAALDAVPAPATVTLARVRVEGGASLTGSIGMIALATIDAGELFVSVDGPAEQLPTGEPESQASTLPIGRSVALRSGDRVAFPSATSWTARNEGAVAASLLLVTIEDQALSLRGAATPAAIATGVTIQALGAAVVEQPPRGRAAITLERFRLQPGSVLPAYPGPLLLSVEEGRLTTTLEAGRVLRSRGGALAADLEAAPDRPDKPVTIRPGDALYFPAGIEQSPPLGGEDDLVLLRLGLLPLPREAAPNDADLPADDGRLVVTAAAVRLRAGPSTSSQVVTELALGDALIVTGEAVVADDRRWYPVRLGDDPAVSGYVAAEFVAPESP